MLPSFPDSTDGHSLILGNGLGEIIAGCSSIVFAPNQSRMVHIYCADNGQRNSTPFSPSVVIQSDLEFHYGEQAIQAVLDGIQLNKIHLLFAPSPCDGDKQQSEIGCIAVEVARRLNDSIQLIWYEFDVSLNANTVVDVTPYRADKARLLNEWVGPIDTQKIALRDQYRALGAGYTAAEAFTVVEPQWLLQSAPALLPIWVPQQPLSTPTYDQPLVSVLIRSMDRPELTEALASLSAQTYPALEVVVVNAKGPGHLPLGAWCGRFPLRLVDGPGPLPRAAAANLGLRTAAGEFLMFLDDDDLVDPDHIATLVGALQKHPRHVAAHSGVRVVNQDGKVVDTYREPVDRCRMLGRNRLPIHSVLFRQPLVNACQFDESLGVFEDWDFWLQVTGQGPLAFVDHVSASYRAALGTSGISLDLSVDLRQQGHDRVFNKWFSRWSARDWLSYSKIAESHIDALAHQIAGFRRQLDEMGNLVKHLEDEAELRNTTLLDLRSRITAQDHEGQVRDQFIADLQQRLDEQDQEATRRNQYVEELLSRIRAQDEEGKQRDDYIAELDRHIKATGDIHLEAQRQTQDYKERNEEFQRQFDHIQRQIAFREAYIIDAEKGIIERDQEIRLRNDLIAELQHELKSMRESTSWTLTAPLRKSIAAAQSLLRRRPRLRTWLADCATRWNPKRRKMERYYRLRDEVEGWKNVPPPVLAMQNYVFSDRIQDLMSLVRHADTPPYQLPETVDIIIPVYNGMEFLPALFDSLYQHTAEPYRLIVVDDCSPNPEVWPFLQQRVARKPGALLLRNPQNLGFVGTVNRAAALAEHHFVLLNTDVELPPNWLPRLMRPMFDYPLIASVTPLTNAGTICSFPQFLEDNTLLPGLTVADIDRFFADLHAMPLLHEVPTGVGFCMAVNRHVAREIGMFDAATFGAGYGEENDWCQRAKQHGFYNVMAPNLFVYHKHGGSFTPEKKKKLVAENLQKLQLRYPDYFAQVQTYVERNPIRSVRDYALLRLTLPLASTKPMLIVDHNLGGGTNIYRDLLIRQKLDAGHPVLLYLEDYRLKRRRLVYRYQAWQAEFSLGHENELLPLLAETGLSEVFYNNAVSFFDPLRLPDFLGVVAEQTQADITVAFHDYFPICPSYTLLNAESRYCAVPDFETCDRCLPHIQTDFFPTTTSIKTWREEWGKLLAKAKRALVFSQAAADIVAKAYPDIAVKIDLRPHTVDFRPARLPTIDKQAPLCIGVLGAINLQKGSGVLAAMSEIIEQQQLPIRLVIVGYTNLNPLPTQIEVTGSYERDDLPEIIEREKINVFLLPSIWPETFSYVTSELMLLNVPLCCFDVGAPAERVQKYEQGLILSSYDAEAIIEQIQQWQGRDFQNRVNPTETGRAVDSSPSGENICSA